MVKSNLEKFCSYDTEFSSQSTNLVMDPKLWHKGEPDDSGYNEDCVILVTLNSFEAADVPCTGKHARGFVICEYIADSD